MKDFSSRIKTKGRRALDPLTAPATTGASCAIFVCKNTPRMKDVLLALTAFFTTCVVCCNIFSPSSFLLTPRRQFVSRTRRVETATFCCKIATFVKLYCCCYISLSVVHTTRNAASTSSRYLGYRASREHPALSDLSAPRCVCVRACVSSSTIERSVGATCVLCRVVLCVERNDTFLLLATVE